MTRDPGPSQAFLRHAPVLVVALAYLGLGRAAFAASVSHDIVTLVVFGAEGAALAGVLRWGPRAALGVFAGQLLLALSTGLPAAPSLAVSLVNALECLLAGWLFRRTRLDADLPRLRDVLLLMGGSALVLQPFSASLGTSALWALGRVQGADLPLAAASWWIGNVLGQCIFAPAFLVLTKASRTWFPGPLLAALGIALLGALAFGILGTRGLPSFALSLVFFFPLVTCTAVALGVEGGALASLALCGVTVAATHLGRGPFTGSWFELDLFLAGGNLTALALGALSQERRQMVVALRDQNRALETANQDLAQALAEVQTLEGLLPICAYCKQVRDDRGYWASIEEYFTDRSHILFSHGICPQCRKEHFPDVPNQPVPPSGEAD